jgi:hypothetical protein
MALFPSALADAQSVFGDTAATTYVTNAERVSEARRVAPCVERFVYGELDLSGELSVGRIGAQRLPTLAQLLDAKLRAASREVHVGVTHAIRQAVAAGYLAEVQSEPDATPAVVLVADRTPQAIWGFWALGARSRLEGLGVDKSWANKVRGLGASRLVTGLKQLNLTKFFGGSKLNQLGMIYAQAGVLLRITQTDAVADDELLAKPAQMQSALGPRWLYEDYPFEE